MVNRNGHDLEWAKLKFLSRLKCIDFFQAVYHLLMHLTRRF